MKKSELRSLVREQVQAVLKESIVNEETAELRSLVREQVKAALSETKLNEFGFRDDEEDDDEMDDSRGMIGSRFGRFSDEDEEDDEEDYTPSEPTVRKRMTAKEAEAKIEEWLKSPKKYKSDEDLDLSDCDATSLPANFSKIKIIKGDLRLNGSKFTSLPNNLTIEGNLYAERTSITELPENLIIKGQARFQDSKLVKLPKNPKVGDWLDCDRTPIKTIPVGFTVNAKKGVQLSTCKNLIELPKGIKIKTDLDLMWSAIKTIPVDIEVGGTLNLKETSFSPESVSKPGREAALKKQFPKVNDIYIN